MIVKSLENKWGVNVHITPIARFRKLALVRGRKQLFKVGISQALKEVRTDYGQGVPGYLHLKREVAASVVRFRMGYGPDIVSLKKRGLCGGVSSLCRWCAVEDESADHLLLRCVGVAFLTHSLWKWDSIVDVCGDRAEWKFEGDDVGQILANVYDLCSSQDKGVCMMYDV